MKRLNASPLWRGLQGGIAPALLALVVCVVLPTAAPGGDAPPAPAAKKGALLITIVYDNYPFDERLETDWGFACVVEGTEKTILFDTGGKGDVLLGNMRKLKIDPKTIDAVVLSHGHTDHTGGLEAFLQANGGVKVFMPKAFSKRLEAVVRKSGAALVETEGPTKICEGAWTTGVLDGAIPEQGIYLSSAGGPVVVTGCAHPGIVKLAAAARAHARKPVFAVLGGWHMGGASRPQIQTVIEGLKGLGVRRVAPTHCCGNDTRRLMKEAFGEGYMPSGVGARLTFEDQRDQVPLGQSLDGLVCGP